MPSASLIGGLSPVGSRDTKGSGDFREESLGLLLQVPGCFCQDFLGQAARTVRIADGIELLRQGEFGGQGVAAFFYFKAAGAEWRTRSAVDCFFGLRLADCRRGWRRSSGRTIEVEGQRAQVEFDHSRVRGRRLRRRRLRG